MTIEYLLVNQHFLIYKSSFGNIVKAFQQAGIDVRALFENFDKAPGFFLSRYADNPDFDESFFIIN